MRYFFSIMIVLVHSRTFNQILTIRPSSSISDCPVCLNHIGQGQNIAFLELFRFLSSDANPGERYPFKIRLPPPNILEVLIMEN